MVLIIKKSAIFLVILLLNIYQSFSLNVTEYLLYNEGNLALEFYKNVILQENNEISAECLESVNNVKQSLTAKELWAVKVIDSWGKFWPAGIFKGNFMEFGNFDECLEIENVENNFSAKYCLAQQPFNGIFQGSNYQDMLKMKTGVCMPQACSSSEINTLMKQFYGAVFKVDLKTEIVTESLCTIKETFKLEGLNLAAIIILIILFIIVVCSTIYDCMAKDTPKNVLYYAFSVRHNLNQLLKVNTNSNAPHVINCLHGIRCITIMWIIFAHGYMFYLMGPNINPIDIFKWTNSPSSMFLQSGTMSVDTFFFLSGLLLVMVALREMERTKGKLSVPKMYLHRYLRITPVLALAILIYMSLYRYLGTGPLWYNFTRAYELCENTWWMTLLYVQNYAAAGGMCFGHSWYLAIDMQFYILSPIVLFAIYRWHKKAIAGLIVFGLLLCGCLFSIIAIKNLNILDTTENLGADNIEMRTIYYATQTRASPYIIGIICGYFMHQNKNKRFKLSKIFVVLAWLVSMCLLLICIFALYSKNNITNPLTSLEGAFYLTFARVAWPLALSWVIFACQFGYGGIINNFLSWSLWHPISRLSYCMYIWHLLVETINTGRLRTNTYFSNYDVMLRFWGDLCITIFISALMYLIIEAPMVGIEKALFNARKNKNISQEELVGK